MYEPPLLPSLHFFTFFSPVFRISRIWVPSIYGSLICRWEKSNISASLHSKRQVFSRQTKYRLDSYSNSYILVGTVKIFRLYLVDTRVLSNPQLRLWKISRLGWHPISEIGLIAIISQLKHPIQPSTNIPKAKLSVRIKPLKLVVPPGAPQGGGKLRSTRAPRWCLSISFAELVLTPSFALGVFVPFLRGCSEEGGDNDPHSFCLIVG